MRASCYKCLHAVMSCRPVGVLTTRCLGALTTSPGGSALERRLRAQAVVGGVPRPLHMYGRRCTPAAVRYLPCPLSAAEEGLLTLIEDYWASFARTGWPVSASAAVAWVPLQEGAAVRATMQLDLPSQPVAVDSMAALCEFWRFVD
jgi:hypothetical protein